MTPNHNHNHNRVDYDYDYDLNHDFCSRKRLIRSEISQNTSINCVYFTTYLEYNYKTYINLILRARAIVWHIYRAFDMRSVEWRIICISMHMFVDQNPCLVLWQSKLNASVFYLFYTSFTTTITAPKYLKSTRNTNSHSIFWYPLKH